MTDYVKEMRRLIGHRPLILCGGSVICLDGAGRVLLGRRADNHLWSYAGGALELDEVVEDCARRELYEEMGLAAEELEFFFVNSGPEAHYVYPNGDPVYNVDVVFVCSVYHGTVKADPEEILELKWYPPDQIPEDLSPQIRTPLHTYIKSIKEEQHHGRNAGTEHGQNA